MEERTGFIARREHQKKSYCYYDIEPELVHSPPATISITNPVDSWVCIHQAGSSPEAAILQPVKWYWNSIEICVIGLDQP